MKTRFAHYFNNYKMLVGSFLFLTSQLFFEKMNLLSMKLNLKKLNLKEINLNRSIPKVNKNLKHISIAWTIIIIIYVAVAVTIIFIIRKKMPRKQKEKSP